MPFVLRQVAPVYLSRTTSSATDDDPRTSISNATLSACLRQLASLVSLAGDIFSQCHGEAERIHQRTVALQGRLDKLTRAVESADSRTDPIRKKKL